MLFTLITKQKHKKLTLPEKKWKHIISLKIFHLVSSVLKQGPLFRGTILSLFGLVDEILFTYHFKPEVVHQVWTHA